MRSCLALYFLGTPQLSLDNEPILVQRRKAVALLAYIAIEQGQHPRETLSALLWPDYDQSKAFTNLRHTLWEIQKSIGEGWLIADHQKIGLNANADTWLDLQQFESLLVQAYAQNNPSARIPLLAESTNLYRNHFLTGFSLKDAPIFTEWMFAKSDDLRSQFAGALSCLADDYCALGQAETAIPYARRLITLDPLNESAYRQMMKVYWQAGQHSAALKQYQVCEEVLRKELSLNPQPETYALYKQIRKGEGRPAQIAKQEVIAPNHDLPLQISTSVPGGKEQGRIEVNARTEHDPTANLYVPDAWFRWLLLAAEDTIGKLAVRVVLRNVGFEHIIGNYPRYEQPRPTKKFTFGDYATVYTGLLDFCGPDGQSQMLEMGRAMVKHTIMEQGALFGIGTITFPKFASLSTQLKIAMEVILEGVRKASQPIGQDHRVFIEDWGSRLAYINQDCIFCAGKESNKPMCMYLTGNLQRGLYWLTGAAFHIEEVECRAMGAKACVWEIYKQPLEFRTES